MASLTLTSDQIRHFDEQGFLVIRAQEHQLVDPVLLKQWSEQVRCLPREAGKWMAYDEVSASGQRQIMRTESFVDFHPELKTLICGSRLNHILKQLTRDDMILFKDKINYKLAGGNGFGAHLDAPAYDHIKTIEHTTANFAVDAATLANGCVEVVPGSHKMHVDLANGTGAIDDEWEARQTWVPCELEPADLLIFGSHLAHRSGKNETDKPRASVYATFSNRSDGLDLRERYYEDRRENFPPENEMKEGVDYSEGMKRYGFAAPFMHADMPKVTSVV